MVLCCLAINPVHKHLAYLRLIFVALIGLNGYRLVKD